jgi:hypothetical protein
MEGRAVGVDIARSVDEIIDPCAGHRCLSCKDVHSRDQAVSDSRSHVFSRHGGPRRSHNDVVLFWFDRFRRVFCSPVWMQRGLDRTLRLPPASRDGAKNVRKRSDAIVSDHGQTVR